MSWFKFGIGESAASNNCEIKEIFPLSLVQDDFTRTDILNTYLKILTDTVERTHGLTEKIEPLLWDNCLQNEANDGLITLLAKAMAYKSDLFLVYVPSVTILRKATSDEERKIREDYKAKGSSTVGVFLSFKHYRRTDMLLIYSSFEYCVLSSLNKTLNVSKAVQLKMHELRGGTALNDSSIVIGQAKNIAEALGRGNDILIDAKDVIETAKVDTAPTEKAVSFLDAKKAFILNLPASYISGTQTAGIGSTGDADARAIDRGLKPYFISIIKPALRALFGADTEFKSEDTGGVTIALEAAKTFDLVSDENLSQASKREILARLFDIDPEEEAANLEDEAAQREKDAAQAPTLKAIPAQLPPGVQPPVKAAAAKVEA